MTKKGGTILTLERCYSSIDRYLNREDESAPRFVNVESVEDMAAIVDHYKVGENIVLTIEKYSSEDENPRRFCIPLTQSSFVT